MSNLYPPSPQHVPEALTKPTRSFVRHAWLAVVALLLFGILYFGTFGFFVWNAWKMVKAMKAKPDDLFVLALTCGLSVLMALLMIRGLWPKKRHDADEDDRIEVTAESEPQLYQFICQVADEVKAPRPAAIYLSNHVNASMFYEVRLHNLIIPVKKKLEIGFGLINVLNLSEFKAVLAHEFGHFSQARSSAVGRYVYISQRIVSEFLGARGWIDSLLRGLSQIDLRLAWLGWLGRILAWSVRSVFETIFGWILIAERALGRQMEFHADSVAVSAAGSDAIVNGLYKLRAADNGLSQSLSFMNTLGSKGKAIPDVFDVQHNIIERMTNILGQSYSQPTSCPPGVDPATHRVFEQSIAIPPQMWSTHPANTDREDNAKRIYVFCPQDVRSPWLLFRDAEGLKQQATRDLYKTPETLDQLSLDNAREAVHAEYGDEYLSTRYMGIYIDRHVTRSAAKVEDLFELTPTPTAWSDLYPESLRDLVESLDQLEKEESQLKALAIGIADAPGGVVRFRGEDFRAKDIPRLQQHVNDELAKTDKSMSQALKRIRSAHRFAAKALGPQWLARHTSHVQLVHYLEHVVADLGDLKRVFDNDFQHAVADGEISTREADKLVHAGTQLYLALEKVYGDAPAVQLSASGLTAAPDGSSADWKTQLGEFKFGPPSRDNLGDWLGAVDSWVYGTTGPAGVARDAALNDLLRLEAQIAERAQHGRVNDDATSVEEALPAAPKSYATLLTREKRSIREKLGLWDRIQLGQGWFGGAVRIAAAGSIIAALAALGTVESNATIYCFNGLARPVLIDINGTEHAVPTHQHAIVIIPSGDHTITTRTQDTHETIETKQVATDDFETYVYNVAGAHMFIEAQGTYGGVEPTPRLVNRFTWMHTTANYVLEEPPTSGESGKEVHLVHALPFKPILLISSLENDADRAAVALTHARWTPLTDPSASFWLGASQSLASQATLAVISQREAQTGPHVLFERIKQDATTNCEAWPEQARVLPEAAQGLDEADQLYLAWRCRQGDLKQWSALRIQFADNPWILMATGYAAASEMQWVNAGDAFADAMKRLPALVEHVFWEHQRVRAVLTKEKLRAIPQGAPDDQTHFLFSIFSEADLMTTLGINRTGSETDESTVRELAGASRNARPALRKALLETKPDELRIISPILVWAVAHLEKQPTAPYRDLILANGKLSKEEVDAKRVIAFLEFVASPDFGARSQGDTLLGAQAPRDRGLAYMAAVMILGDKCPKEWKELADQLLFPFETPIW